MNRAKYQNAIVGAVVALVVLGGLAYYLFTSSAEPAPSVGPALPAIEDTLSDIASPEVSVPTSADPAKQVLPQETPLDKTNPFKDAYVNPFE